MFLSLGMLLYLPTCPGNRIEGVDLDILSLLNITSLCLQMILNLKTGFSNLLLEL